MRTEQQLPDIDEIEPLSEADEECLREVREVLTRHGALRRFGLTLLHEHFPLAESEVLVEFVDSKERTLTSRPVDVAALAGVEMVGTEFRLDVPSAKTFCTKQCPRQGGKHVGSVHLKVKG